MLSFSQIKATGFWEEPCLTSHDARLPTALMSASATQTAVGIQYFLCDYALNVLDRILWAMKINPERVLLAFKVERKDFLFPKHIFSSASKGREK